MSGETENSPAKHEPAKEGEPHKVDETVQEEAGRERAKEGGYD